MPKIIGITKNDMVPAVLQAIDKKWVSCDKNSDCYIYYFARSLPGDEKGAWHSSDLLYAFSTLDKNWRPFEAVDYEISNQPEYISIYSHAAKSSRVASRWNF